MKQDRSDPMYEEEVCFGCDGGGCETCNETGKLYTPEAIRLQLEAEEQNTDKSR